MIITFASRKGGTGKSTLACSFAAYLKNEGESVCLFDADPQKTSKRWADLREATYIEEDKIDIFHGTGNIVKTLRTLEQKYEFVVVDCVGKDSIEMRSSLIVADRAVLPTCPSVVDRDTIPYLASVIREAKKENKKLKTFAVVTLASDNEKQEVNETLSVLKEHKLNPASVVIKKRAAYKSMMAEGLGVTESNDKSAYGEMTKFIGEVMR